MNHIIHPSEYRAMLQCFCMQMNFTHVLTLTIQSKFQTIPRAELLCGRFIHHLNVEVWGNNLYKKNKAALSFMAVLEDNNGEHLHLHAAIGNFRPKLKSYQLMDKVRKAKRMANGFWHKFDFGPIQSQPAWVSYIMEDVDGFNDERLLIQHMSRGIAPKTDE